MRSQSLLLVSSLDLPVSLGFLLFWKQPLAIEVGQGPIRAAAPVYGGHLLVLVIQTRVILDVVLVEWRQRLRH